MSAQSSGGFQPPSESLPSGWTMTTIGQVVLKKVEQHVPSGSGTIRYIDIGSVDNAAKIITEAKSISAATAPSRARQKVTAGDVLVSMTRPNLNAVALVPPDLSGATASTGFDVLRPTSAVLSDWLFLHVRSRRFVGAMTTLVQGALYPAVRPSNIRNFPIPLPPLPEQRRIVARLEALEARSRRARAKLAEVPAQLAQARQSLLAAAFRGDLTADWRTTNRTAQSGLDLLGLLQAYHTESPAKKGNAAQATVGVHELDSASLPSTWAIADLRTLCRPDRPICYGILMPGPELEIGVPYVRVADFPKDRIRLETVRKTSPDIDAKFARSRLSAGDILLSIRGTVGRLAVVPPELEGANITQDTARLSIHPSVSRDFVLLMLRSPDTLLRMQSAVKGVAVRGINIGDVRPLQIPLPPLPEQHEIVRRLNAAFAKLDAAASAHAAAVAALDLFDQSLLARAFSGAL